MMESIHLSAIGIIYLLLLFIPNLIWIKYQPRGYDPSLEKRSLVILERVGEVFVTIFAVVCFHEVHIQWNVNLCLSVVCMFLYELYWIRYFLGPHTLLDFYRPFCHVMVPGATFPVVGFLLLAISIKHIFLMISTLILAIGHIGIHFHHFQEMDHHVL